MYGHRQNTNVSWADAAHSVFHLHTYHTYLQGGNSKKVSLSSLQYLNSALRTQQHSYEVARVQQVPLVACFLRSLFGLKYPEHSHTTHSKNRPLSGPIRPLMGPPFLGSGTCSTRGSTFKRRVNYQDRYRRRNVYQIHHKS
jgi:hypothetical protein